MIRLVSGSETRAKLLKEAGIEFIQSPIYIDEERFLKLYSDPKKFVCAVAREKMKEAKKQFSLEIPLVVADTVVSVNGEILRKAKTPQEAKELLLKQSGKRVDILTCMVYASKDKEVEDLDITSYHFAPFKEKDLEEYLKTQEWRGKAGACMVEGFCKKYIQKVEGRESTARGLQVERLKEIAKDS